MRISKNGLDPVIFFFTPSISSCQLAQKLVTFCFAILLYFNFFSKHEENAGSADENTGPMLEIQENRPKIAKIQEIQDRWDLCLCILPNYADSNFYKSVYRKNL